MFRSKLFKLLLALFILTAVTLPTLVFAQTAATTGPSQNNTVWINIVNTRGVVQVWRVSLALVDFIVVAGLIASAFANIFRFKIDTYSVKQILPGLIIGIILANLSFFIMRLFIEGSTIFTQFIGTIAEPYSGGTIGNTQVGVFLATRAAHLMVQSFFTFPDVWSTVLGFGAAATGGAFAAPAVATVLATGGAPLTVAAIGAVAGVGLLLALLLLFAMIAPFIMFIIIMFLLYVRNYILILCFMISPIAFFALGFPPLRKFWQTFWSNFWKWLVMPFLVWVVVAFLVIFLNAANVQEAGTARSGFDYLFYNGIAILLLFFALRVPFMFGSFFGVNIMDKWAGVGKKGVDLSRRGSKRGWDAGARQLNMRFARNPMTSFSDIEGKLDKLRAKGYDAARFSAIKDEVEKAMPNASAAEKVAEIRKRAGAELARVQATRNPYRQFQAAANVYKNYLEEQSKIDARHIRRSRTYGRLSREYTTSTFTSEQYQRYAGDYQDNEDIEALTGVARDFFQRLVPLYGKEAPRIFRQLISTSADNLDRELGRMHPELANMDNRAPIINEIVGSKQLRRALNINRRSADWRTYVQGAVDPATGAYNPAAEPTPYTGAPTPQTGGSTISVVASAEGSRGRVIPVAIQQVTGRAAQTLGSHLEGGTDVPTMHLSEEDRDVLAGSRPETILGGTHTLLRQQEGNIRTLLSSSGVSPDSMGDIVSKVRNRAHDTQSKDWGNSGFYGLRPEQFTQEIQSAIRDYGRSVRGTERVMYNSRGDDDSLEIARTVAKTIDGNQARQLESVVSNLQSRLASGATPQQLVEMRNQLAAQAPTVRISPQVDQGELERSLKNTQLAVKLHAEAGGNDPAKLDKAIARLQGEKMSFQTLANTIDSQRRTNPSLDVESLVNSQELQEAMESAIGTMRHIDPTLHQSKVELNPDHIKTVSRALAAPIMERLQAAIQSDPETRARDFIDSDELTDELRAIMRGQFQTIATAQPTPAPTPPPDIPQNQTPTSQ